MTLWVVPAGAHPALHGFICHVMSLDSKRPTSFGKGLLLVSATADSLSPGFTVNVPDHSMETDPNVAVPFTWTVSPARHAAVVTVNLAVNATLELRGYATGDWSAAARESSHSGLGKFPVVSFSTALWPLNVSSLIWTAEQHGQLWMLGSHTGAAAPLPAEGLPVLEHPARHMVRP